MKECQDCKKDQVIWSDQKYCQNCGSSNLKDVDVRCPKCNKVTCDHWEFCTGCGAKLTEVAAPKPYTNRFFSFFHRN